MLRSLVGSEMCIRDSIKRFGSDAFNIGHNISDICPHGRYFDFYNHLLWTCLLYTSDAADDLLCVDLGGRRILKKKTKHITLRISNDNKSNINISIQMILHQVS